MNTIKYTSDFMDMYQQPTEKQLFFNVDDFSKYIQVLRDGFIFSNDFLLEGKFVNEFGNEITHTAYFDNGFYIDDIPYAFFLASADDICGNVFPNIHPGNLLIGNVYLCQSEKYDYVDASAQIYKKIMKGDNTIIEYIQFGIMTALKTMADIMNESKKRSRKLKEGHVPQKYKYSREHRISTERKKIWLFDDIVQYASEKQVRNKAAHEIECPCWEVRGHYRHYKNGKIVFIKSYKKGKERDKVAPNGKEYIAEGRQA